MANPSAYKLSFVLCKSTGEPVGESLKASDRKLSRRRNTPGTASISWPLHDPFAALVIPGLSRLKVYRSASPSELALNPAAAKVLVWYGSLPAENTIEDADTGFMNATFVDPRWVLKMRFLTAPASFAATDQAAILASIVNTQITRQNIWLTPSGSTGILRDRNYDAGKNVSDLIDEMTKVTNGCDVDVSPTDGYTAFGTRAMGNLNFLTRQGTDKPNVIFRYQQVVGTSGGGNITGVKRSYAPIINSSTQVGTAADGTSSSQTFTLPTGYDLLEDYQTSSDATIAGSLLEAAAGVVSENASLRSIWTVGAGTWDAPLPFVDFDLGDTVRLRVQRGPMVANNLAVKVDGYDLVVDQEGNVHSTPILTSAA